MYHEQRFLRTTYYFFERRSTTATTDRSPRATHQAGQRHTRYAGSRRLKLQPPFFNLRAKEKPARNEWTPAVCGGLRVKEGARTWVLVVVGWWKSGGKLFGRVAGEVVVGSEQRKARRVCVGGRAKKNQRAVG